VFRERASEEAGTRRGIIEPMYRCTTSERERPDHEIYDRPAGSSFGSDLLIVFWFLGFFRRTFFTYGPDTLLFRKEPVREAIGQF
jgi:hypothetical protein